MRVLTLTLLYTGTLIYVIHWYSYTRSYTGTPIHWHSYTCSYTDTLIHVLPLVLLSHVLTLTLLYTFLH